MEDHQSEAYARTWRDLRNSLERLTQVKERLHINANQCLHMQSEISKLLQALRQDQSPAAREFFGIAMRALKLVEECSTERWLLKAVEIGDCPEHFVELYLDLRWSSTVLSLTGQEMISISEVYKVRDEDKRSLMSKVNEVLEGDYNKNYRRCQVEQQLAAILRDRNGCSTPQTSAPHDLKIYVRRFRFDILTELFFQRVKGGSSFIVKYRWVYDKEFVLKLALKSCGELDDIIKREAKLMEKCRHPYVVGVVGCWEVKASKSFMVMECMKCTLKELIDERRITATKQGFSASEAIDLLLPIAKALRYMHREEGPMIAHRDIKPDNIMCSREPEVDTKLIDFGESVEFDPRCFSRNGVALTEHRYGVAGTTGYIAPEVRDCNKCEPGVFPFCDLLKADVFSFGMVLGELLTWKTPEEALCAQARGTLMSRSALNALLERGWRPQLPHDVPAYVAFIVESCWRKSPSTRPSFEDICLMLQNAQHLLRLNVTHANEDTSSLVSYTDSDAVEWPIEGKFTSREMLNLEEEMDSEGLLLEFIRKNACR